MIHLRCATLQMALKISFLSESKFELRVKFNMWRTKNAYYFLFFQQFIFNIIPRLEETPTTNIGHLLFYLTSQVIQTP